MNADSNTMAVIWFLVIAPALCALSIPVLSWLEGRNAKKQQEINQMIDKLHE
jgi:hypothetical protein